MKHWHFDQEPGGWCDDPDCYVYPRYSLHGPPAPPSSAGLAQEDSP